jgi:predicted AAA+ superfamily ATPase
MLIDRPLAKARLNLALSRSSAVVLIGPRQCGKTTLCREFVSADSVNYFDLEDPVSLARLEQPMTALANLEGLIVIDEIQRMPDLFPVLRVLIDKDRRPGRFLILGSASLHLLQKSSETLAGRIELIELTGFALSEVGVDDLMRHWLRGSFPLSFLATSDNNSFVWRKNFIRTFMEGDVGQLQSRVSTAALVRFWTMLAHYHSQIWNASELARTLGVGESTTRRYIDLLEDLLMVRQLKPWHENLKKRQVKAPKIYLRDSGLLHQLLGFKTVKDMLEHPKNGASWEGYALEETLKVVAADEAYFWATHQGAELDLLLIKDSLKYGVEFKRVDAPRMTPSIKTAIDDLGLHHLTIIYPGDKSYMISDKVQVMPLKSIATAEASRLVTA